MSEWTKDRHDALKKSATALHVSDKRPGNCILFTSQVLDVLSEIERLQAILKCEPCASDCTQSACVLCSRCADSSRAEFERLMREVERLKALQCPCGELHAGEDAPCSHS